MFVLNSYVCLLRRYTGSSIEKLEESRRSWLGNFRAEDHCRRRIIIRDINYFNSSASFKSSVVCVIRIKLVLRPAEICRP